MKDLSIAIVGAGTAGLATAILLARQGWRVEVLERVPSLQPVGAEDSAPALRACRFT
ncbi:FAD-dependent oxidoreductase [Phytopseudomonas seleniipraecipitans]|uniref:FAD-dependent oxidoreductase n=1 Tax=Phytopseudomonas seleniipraecipitans TaxID=640205 RepID=UPI001FC8F24A|nr:FAD-dependent oxidoreductase [Pseudomonas seleniipraecipitans]